MSNTRKLRGQLPPYIVKGLKRDRNGLYSGKVIRFFEVGEQNQRIDLAWLEPGSAPRPWAGLPCVDVDADIQPPLCCVTYFYEGVSDSFTFSSEEETTFELDAAMEEKVIETHPAFASLKKTFGWNQAERMFSEQLAAEVSNTSGLSNTQSKGKPNPLFGTDSWLSVGALYRMTIVSRTIPGDVLEGIGTIVKAPTGIKQFKLPTGMGRRNWLKLAPKVSRQGNAVRVTYEWMLSGPNGWLSQVYSLAQLGSRGGDSPGSGLRTGGLTTGGL